MTGTVDQPVELEFTPCPECKITDSSAPLRPTAGVEAAPAGEGDAAPGPAVPATAAPVALAGTAPDLPAGHRVVPPAAGREVVAPPRIARTPGGAITAQRRAPAHLPRGRVTAARIAAWLCGRWSR